MLQTHTHREKIRSDKINKTPIAIRDKKKKPEETKTEIIARYF